MSLLSSQLLEKSVHFSCLTDVWVSVGTQDAYTDLDWSRPLPVLTLIWQPNLKFNFRSLSPRPQLHHIPRTPSGNVPVRSMVLFSRRIVSLPPARPLRLLRFFHRAQDKCGQSSARGSPTWVSRTTPVVWTHQNPIPEHPARPRGDTKRHGGPHPRLQRTRKRIQRCPFLHSHSSHTHSISHMVSMTNLISQACRGCWTCGALLSRDFSRFSSGAGRLWHRRCWSYLFVAVLARDRCVGSVRSDSTRLAVNSTTNSGKRGIRTLPREQLPINGATQSLVVDVLEAVGHQASMPGACPHEQSMPEESILDTTPWLPYRSCAQVGKKEFWFNFHHCRIESQFRRRGDCRTKMVAFRCAEHWD